jgi:hypothetical protein
MNAVIQRDSDAVQPVPQTVGAITPMAMIQIAVQQGADIDKLEKLMGLQERWEKNEARKAFDDAIASAKSEIPVVHKNKEVDFTSAKGRTNYRYEDLAEVARTVDPILAKHGLSYRFRTTSTPNEPVAVTCIISHRAGHREENTLHAARDDSGNKNGIQAIGSTLTYLQRMTLKASLGLSAATDDDGSGAGKGKPEAAEPDPEGKKALEACGSLPSLQAAWKALTPEQRKTLSEVANDCRAKIKAAEKAAE